MIARYAKIFFDLDGTLSDSYPGIANGMRFALEKMGVYNSTDGDIKRLIGIPLYESLYKYYFNDEGKTDKAVQYYREYYAERGIKESELYPGVLNLLEELSDMASLYVVTAKPTGYAHKLLEHHGAAHLFTAILGCSMDNSSFSKSELIMQVPGCTQSIIIGDKRQDIIAGKEAGIKTGGVLYGYGTRQELLEASPDFVIDSVLELKKVLCG